MLIAVSVGVFLVIVVSAAILVSNTGVATVPEVSQVNNGYNRSATTDPSEMARDNAYMGLQDPNSASPIQDAIINSESGTTVINVPKPATAAVPDVAPAAKPAAKPADKPQPVQAKPAPEAPKKLSRDYWVQAGSFSTRERADGVKDSLGTKGITAIVTNQDINGNTYYRVRVGPYTSQNEADYWLAMIKSIDGFQESQIWESQSFR